MILIEYKLFNIGNKLFFQILQQDECLISKDGERMMHEVTYIGTQKVVIGSACHPEISVLLGFQINVYLRGDDRTRDSIPMWSTGTEELVNDITSAISFFISENAKDIRWLRAHSHDGTKVIYYTDACDVDCCEYLVYETI